MNEVTEEKKTALTKTFAIIGFIVLVIFAVWLAVQVVRLLPSAFSSLASLADSVYSQKQELEVATPNSVINAGETFTINWTKMRQDGTYSFTYKCTEGVAVDVKNATGEIVSLACDTPFALETGTSLEVLVASEKYRFVDVPYAITFIQTGSTEPLVTSKTITIVNATIPASSNLGTDDNEVTVKPIVPSVPSKPVVTTPVKTTPTYTAGTPTTVTKYVYSVPVSDPKGKIDLQITYIGVGTLNGKTFTPSKNIEVDEEGALQFEVKNIGTKTSGEWSYEANLPSDITYTSGDQKALKPNERAVITLGFEGISKTGSEKISVELDVNNDVKSSNNEFDKTISIVK